MVHFSASPKNEPHFLSTRAKRAYVIKITKIKQIIVQTKFLLINNKQ
ncbi:MAG: hypothetical protein U5L45_20390 [Saprospiraceae bacterium]|nr:hypothetical protein [Saprospiraceae bacterium]